MALIKSCLASGGGNVAPNTYSEFYFDGTTYQSSVNNSYVDGTAISINSFNVTSISVFGVKGKSNLTSSTNLLQLIGIKSDGTLALIGAVTVNRPVDISDYDVVIVNSFSTGAGLGFNITIA